MKGISIFFILVIVLILLWFIFVHWPNQPESTLQKDMTENKQIAMIIAFNDFRDEEYFLPKEILEKAGFKVVTVSNQLGSAQGVNGGQAVVDNSLDQLVVEDYQAIVFVGGPGCLTNLDNSASYQIAQEAVKQNKVLAAICISPVILAKAGLLKDKQATVWASPTDQGPIKILKEKGALYQDKPVVVDGQIITANGPGAAEQFGQAIVKTLNQLN